MDARGELYAEPAVVGLYGVRPGRQEVHKRGEICLGVSSMALTCGNCRPSMSATTFNWLRTASAVVCAKMVRAAAATIPPEPFSITLKTSRTK